MNSQFKKGVLEMIVLLATEKKDMYGYELVEEISKVVNVEKGTVYPLLRRLTNERYFETYMKESSEGPARKYYRLTALGKEKSSILKQEWIEFSEKVTGYVKECGENE